MGTRLAPQVGNDTPSSLHLGAEGVAHPAKRHEQLNDIAKRVQCFRIRLGSVHQRPMSFFAYVAKGAQHVALLTVAQLPAEVDDQALARGRAM